jgi:hypothetical protein
MIAGVVPFESFRAEIEAAVLTPASGEKRPAGRKPIDVMVMFRMLVLQSVGRTGRVSSARRDFVHAVCGGWASRTAFRTARRCGYSERRLRRRVRFEKLFERFGQHLEVQGYIARRPDSRQIMSQNHRCAAPAIDPTKQSSLFEVALS